MVYILPSEKGYTETKLGWGEPLILPTGVGGAVNLAKRSWGSFMFRVLARPLSPEPGCLGVASLVSGEEPGPPSLLSQHLWAQGPGSCLDKLSRLTLRCVQVWEPLAEHGAPGGAAALLPPLCPGRRPGMASVNGPWRGLGGDSTKGKYRGSVELKKDIGHFIECWWWCAVYHRS